MKRLIIIASGALGLSVAGLMSTAALAPLAAQSTPAASVRTATFAIANMTCALCPVTVRRAMEGVSGVRSVRVDFEAKTATVVFDPMQTNPAAIAAASTNAGYPATSAR